LLVKLLVFACDFLDIDQTFVLSENNQKVHSDFVERGSFEEGLVEEFDFLLADTGVLGEQSERLAVGVELRKVHHVLINVVEGTFLGGGGEKNAGISAFDGVFA